MATANTHNGQDAALNKMQAGREANAIAGYVGPYVNERIAVTVRRMAAAYRSQQATHDYLLGCTAQIACMLELLSDLDSRARQGSVAAEKELNNAP